MLFADDIILMSATIAGLQNQLNVLHNCTQRLHLNVDLSKTKEMIFRKGGHLSAKEQWAFGYKYVGLFSQQNSVFMLLRTESILLAHDAVHLR